MADTILKTIQTYHDELTKIRQDIHAHPELGFEEVRTSALVAAELERLGYEVTRNVGKTGLVGTLHGEKNTSGRSIGLRADMDALPIVETGDHSYASTKHGVMHACGHDGHTTMLLGAARYLAQTKRFNGTVHLIFQPAEEGQGGAQAMIDDGLFDRFPCDAIFGLHNSPDLTPCKIGVRPGPIMAAVDLYDIHIVGRGGHGAHPYQTKDPVVAASHLVLALQTIVSRNVSALESAVVTVAAIQSGNLQGKNVIPGEARLCGTVRTFREDIQALVIERMERILKGIGETFDMDVTLNYEKKFPATVNTPEYAEFVAEVATELFGEENVFPNYTPSMGSEDFSVMLQERPGAYFRLGQGGIEQGWGLHNASYNFNDDVIPHGSAMFGRLVERFLPL
ncbi:M20 aminoacylase family protein [Orrella sp. 11846]|uniref:M20 aminoacylase family protein n=1 Tax=Orrella sp. 11846 TaxID=3409913 RepID=UPI003B5B23D8